MGWKTMREMAATESGEGLNPGGSTRRGAGRLCLAGGVRPHWSGRRRSVSNRVGALSATTESVKDELLTKVEIIAAYQHEFVLV